MSQLLHWPVLPVGNETQGVVTASIVGSKDTSGLMETLSRSPLTLLNAESCDWNSCCYQISFSVFEGRDYWGVVYLDRGQKLHQFHWSESSAWHQVKTWVKHFQHDFTRNVRFSQSWNIFDKLMVLCSTSWNLLWSGFPAFLYCKSSKVSRFIHLKVSVKRSAQSFTLFYFLFKQTWGGCRG